MNSNSVLVGTSLIFGKSVLLLGDIDRVYKVAHQALNHINGFKNSINISATALLLDEKICTRMGLVAPVARMMTRLDNTLKNNPSSILRINGVESLPIHYMMFVLQQWAEGRKVLLVGTDCAEPVLFDRFEIVRV